MESQESTTKIPNDDEATKLSNESTEKLQQCEKVPCDDDVKIKREVTTKVKRVSFHFGTALSARREETTTSDSKDITLSTIQNIYESKTEPNQDDANLVRNNSTKSRINKSAYIKLHRHSFSSTTGNSSVDKLKGRYENIAKQTDNNSKANIVARAKVNTDKNSTYSAKNVIDSDKQGKTSNSDVLKAEFINNKEQPPDSPTEKSGDFFKAEEDSNPPKEKSTNVLKAEFINSTPKTETSKPCETPEPSKTPQTTEETKTDTSEKLQKTTSNIQKLQNNLSTKLSNYTIEQLRSKYSPASFGYPRDTTAPKLQKKVQFSEEPISKIPVPAPRVSVKPKDKEENKSVEDTSADSAASTSKEKIQSVTVKLVSVPEVTEQSSADPEQNNAEEIKSETPEESPKVKDENCNVVVTAEVPNEKPKQKPPILTSKPIIPKVPKENLRPKSEEIKSPTVEEITGIEVEVTYDNIEFAEPEDKHFIVRHSSSEDSIDKVENFFSSEIIMDKKSKEKKRSNSFKKILTGGLFGRDKKKDEEKSKHKKKDNAVFADNAQNESQAFDRNSSHRHTIDNSFPRREVPKNSFHSNPQSGPLYYYSPQTQYRRPSDDANFQNRYTEMKGSNGGSFVSNRHPKYSPEEYVPMDNGNSGRQAEARQTYMNVNKYIDTSSSSSNTLESENRNCTYQNALIAQAEMRQIRENEQRNSQRSGIPVNLNRRLPASQENKYQLNKHSDSPEMFRESPPSSQDTNNLQLVKPKALIPINSERPLPNPYHNNQDNSGNYQNLESKTLDRNLNVDSSKPFPNKNNLYTRTDHVDKTSNAVIVEDVYGTVFDSISSDNPQGNMEYLRTRSLSPQHSLRSGSNCSSPSGKVPASPRSLEASKLKLPSNREKVELQPRIRSPIPQAKISTEKIIATELLRKRSPSSNSPVLRTEAQEKSPTKLQRSPHVSPNRPASYQGMNIYESSANLPNIRNTASPKSNNSSRESPNVNAAHSTPQNVSYNTPNEYMYLNKLSPVPKNKPPVSPRDVSAVDCFQAAEWQRKQRELNKSPALESPRQITTDVTVHVNPEEERIVRNNYSPLPPAVRQKTPTYQQLQQMYHGQGQPPSPRSINSSTNNVRAHTPVQQPIPSPLPKSPEKQHMLHSVEAFYWRELKKLKEREELDLLNYRQQQLHMYGYLEDPVYSRRSRSVSPSMQRGRRSLSLPREVRPMPVGRLPVRSPEPIPEGRPVIAKQPISLPPESSYGQVRAPPQRNLNFIRNTFERSTIGPIGMSKNSKLLYENYHPDAFDSRGKQQNHVPIFKRGSLTASMGTPETQQMSKKVSFSSTQNPNNHSIWPTKNGFTKSPPTRRIEREVSVDDDVFLPNSPRMPPSRQPEDIYVRNHTETEPIYISRQKQPQQARGRELRVIPKSEVNYVNSQEAGRQSVDPVYGRTTKQVTVSNKVCDIYGQIHNSGQQNYGQIQSPTQGAMVSPQNYGQVRQVGLMYGQLQQQPKVGSPVVLRQSYNQLSAPQSNFVRGTRLTASVNDMYKRYPERYQIDPRYQADAIYSNERVEAPYRPLPPLPERRDSRMVPNRKMVRGYVPASESESGSEAGEVQRILQSGTKQKNFSVIGK